MANERLDEQALRDLMLRYQSADPEAAEELVRLLSPLLLRFLSNFHLTREQNEDLLQECWLRIHRARHTFRPEAPLLPWIFGVARHVRREAWRRAARLQAHESAWDECPDHHLVGSSAPDSSQNGNGRDRVMRALDALPEAQKEVILLKLNGRTLEETAHATSSTAGAVKQKVHRAYQTLRQILTRRSLGKTSDSSNKL